MNKQKLIFIVDDDLEDVQLLVTMLNEIDESVDCIVANNGEDALNTIVSLQYLPDTIILDLNMPKLDGKGFLKKIKQQTNLSQIPVIVYTTSQSEADKIETIKLGASLFCTKATSYKAMLDFAKSVIYYPVMA